MIRRDRSSRRRRLVVVLAGASLPVACAGGPRPAASPVRAGANLAARVLAVTGRPEFRHATFGVEVFSLDDAAPVFQLAADKLFVPGSTTKLFTAGTALRLLGADYRFHTRVYRTAPLTPDGMVDGDLVFVGSGDPNLSGRITAAGALAFANEDHSYAGEVDTASARNGQLFVIQRLADQIAARGVRRVRGRVLVDATLFAEGERELGTGVVISPVMVNDNVVDVTVAPGVSPGAPATLTAAPAGSYVRVVNHVTTAAPGTPTSIDWKSDSAAADGSRAVTAAGSIAVGAAPALVPYAVPVPSRFAAAALADALRERGIAVRAAAAATPIETRALSASYTADRVVAEHVSPPLAEEVKVMLKVSQNLHASAMPFTIAAVLARGDSGRTGFDLEREFLTKAGLDVSGAVQGDGAGGLALFTPDFVARFLAYMARQPDFPVYLNALPVLGRDGTLAKIQTGSPAAGHVRAKTGTYTIDDPLNRRTVVTGKGLAGYVTTGAGRRFSFAVYANNVSVKDSEAAQAVVGQALGEIAAAIYETAR